MPKDSKPRGVEMKKNDDGSDNVNYVDLLEEDKPISGQKFACLSFVSPEHIIKQREQFFFEEFLKQWNYKKSMDVMLHFISFISYKYNLTFDKVNEDFQDFVKNEHSELMKYNVNDDFKTFVDNNEERLDADFGEQHEFQTSVRGIKVRGVFASQKEAELRCKLLREVDPNHDVYVGPVGMWVPFHPDAYKTGRVEYMEETLNQLMAEKKKNEDSAKKEFDKRVKDAKEKAIEENKKNAEKSGSKLTQTLNSNGDLVSVKNLSSEEGGDDDVEEGCGDSVTLDDIRKQMFDTENVVIQKNTDHGLSRLAENQKSDDDDDDGQTCGDDSVYSKS
jgi:Family of unknown function (DUF5832)